MRLYPPVATRLSALFREHATGRELGVAVGLGVLIGVSPLFGVQSLLALGLATLLKLNRVAVLLGTQVSLPPIAPLLLFADAQVGARLLHGDWLPLSLVAFRALLAARGALGLLRELLPDLLLGGLLVGSALGLALGTLTGYIVSARQAALPTKDPS